MGWLSGLFRRGDKVVTREGSGVVLGGNDLGGYDVEIQGRWGSRTKHHVHAGADAVRAGSGFRLRGTPSQGGTVMATRDLTDRYGRRIPKGTVGRVVRTSGLAQSGYTIDFGDGERSNLHLDGDIAKADDVTWRGSMSGSSGQSAGEILGDALAKLIGGVLWAIATTFKVVWWMARRRWGQVVLGTIAFIAIVFLTPINQWMLLALVAVLGVAGAGLLAWRYRMRLTHQLERLGKRLEWPNTPAVARSWLAGRETRSLDSLSPDGRWRWTGTTWVPTAPPATDGDEP